VKWSPPAEYFHHVFCDFMNKIGIKIDFEVLKYGFYPKGGGLVKVKVNPSQIKPFSFLTCGKIKSVNVYSIASKHLMKANVADRQVEGFMNVFKKGFNKKILYVESDSPGSCIHANVKYENTKIGVEVLGVKGKPAEKVGEECATKLLNELRYDAPVDERMADQLIPFMVPGSSFRTSKVSNHTKTNIWVCKKFLPYKYEIKRGVIKCMRK